MFFSHKETWSVVGMALRGKFQWKLDSVLEESCEVLARRRPLRRTLLNTSQTKLLVDCKCLCAYLMSKKAWKMHLLLNSIITPQNYIIFYQAWKPWTMQVYSVLNDLYWSSVFDWIGSGDIHVPCRSYCRYKWWYTDKHVPSVSSQSIQGIIINLSAMASPEKVAFVRS